MKPRAVVFAGCVPEVAAGPDGRILAVGSRARAAAGKGAEVVRLRGEAWAGLADSHIHLEGLAERRITLDLTRAKSRDDALARVRRWAGSLPRDAWVVGSGWYNDEWPDPSFPTRADLDRAAGGRPVFLYRKDGHSAWASSAALRRPVSTARASRRVAASSTATVLASRPASFARRPCKRSTP